MARSRYSTVFEENMNEWFDIYSLTDPSEQEELQTERLTESIERVHAIVEEELRHVSADRILLGGISQGCATSVHALLSAPWRLGAFVGFCGWLPFQADLKDAAKAPENVHRRLAAFFQTRLGIRPPASSSVLPSNTTFDSSAGPLQTPVFLGHAMDDDVIDVALGRQLRDTIGAPGLDMNVVWKEYAKGGYQINEEAGTRI
ncbi:hypothetical protein LTR04_004978 [Oleoguttula sp. CCFEE 6159]|nr:hypothetical protein LTR04_004978 [Oleoguttula sp. CCFEE 6159]